MKKSISILIISSVIALMSCSKSEPETAPAPVEPDPIEESHLNPDLVNIDWSTAHVTHYDAENGEFSFRIAGDIPELKAGSVLAIDADTAGCVCIVDSYLVNGQEISVKGHQGDLSNVFENTELVLATVDIPNEVATKASAGDVLVGKPAAVIFTNEEGVSESLPYEVTKGLTKILTCEMKVEDKVLCKTSYGDIKLITARQYFDLGLYIGVKFKGLSVTPNKVEAYLEGNSETEFEVGLEASKKFKKESDPITLVKNALPQYSIKFMVGWVPVFITVGGDLKFKASFEAMAAVRFSTGFTNKFQVRTGFSWEKNKGISPINSCTNKFTFYPLSASVYGSAEAKAYVYPEFKLKLYSVVGPVFDIMPFIGAKAEFSSRTGFSFEKKIGLELQSGVSIGNSTYNTPSITVFEKSLNRN